ncbi:MAG: outer membrane beta-barrel protein [Bacteroidales bacterium]|nr:outer membrane beta-barrel protein [Bacteroidales bacterium]MCF8327935.1 outer membrane beta-barrel protein [Bacteroidales bacterium]
MEIPIKFAYRSDNLQVFAGPYLGFNLGGKQVKDGTISYDGKIGDIEYDGKMEYDQETNIKPSFGAVDPEDMMDAMMEGDAYMAGFDFGFNFGAGYRVDNLMINAGYSIGLANLNPNIDVEGYERSSSKQKNRVVYFSVSYFLDM